MSKGEIVLAVIVVLAVTFVLGMVGLTTHNSHVHQIQHDHDEMVQCIKTPRSAAECRVIVYGSY